MQDLANADCIVIQGSNMAECHPVAYQWVTEARLRGAKVIHVDPRFTRTSATADKHLPIRAGSDVVFLGALINHVLSNDLYFKEYVVAYTNAATILNEDFKDTEDLDGLFSGYDEELGSYDLSTWAYATREDPDARMEREGELLESAVVHGRHHYGTPRRAVEEALAAHRMALLEIDLQGARQVRETMPEALFVFLAPPSWEELVRRLVGRGTEDEEERSRRLETAKVELAAEKEFDVTIVNDDIRRAAEELVSLMRSH